MDSKAPPACSVWDKWWMTYPFALLAPLLTVWFRLAIGYNEGEPTLVLLVIIPIMLSAWIGGLKPGLVATVAATLAASYYLLPPLNSFAAKDIYRIDQIAMLVVGTLSAVFIHLIQSHKKALKMALVEATNLRAALDEHAIVAV